MEDIARRYEAANGGLDTLKPLVVNESIKGLADMVGKLDDKKRW